MSSVYERTVGAQVLGAYGQYSRMTVRMTYRTRDPFAISFIFVVSDDELIEWSFSRDLLASGAVSTYEIGLGDIKIWYDQEALLLELSNGEEAVRVFMPRRDVLTFLRDIYHAVPEGYEMNLVDMDDFIRSCHA